MEAGICPSGKRRDSNIMEGQGKSESLPRNWVSVVSIQRDMRGTPYT